MTAGAALPGRRLAPAIAAACASLAISAGYVFLRPDLSRGAGFFFGDEASNLFVADALHHGQRLYVDVAYPYGPAAILLFARASALLGNTPVVYLATLAVFAALSIGMAAHLVHRAADVRTTLGIVLVGLLPSMPLPGAPIGGYTSSLYFPLERIGLLAALLLWRRPEERPWWRSLAIGAALGVCQGIRFGPGVVMLLAIAIADAIVARGSSRRSAVSAIALVLAGFAAVECVWIGWSALTLPPPLAKEVIWPVQMWETHQESTAARWPTWAGWRMGVTQGVMPFIALALAVWGLLRARPIGATAVALLFFALGVLAFFRNEHHFRQFAWLLVVAAAAGAARLPRRAAAMLLTICLPALWPIASALLHRPSADVAALDVPRGYRLFVSRDVARELQQLAPYAHEGPILFIPNGAGWLYAYDVPHVTRHSWFYSTAVVRPFEEEAFERAAARAAVMIRCAGPPGNRPLRAEIAAFLAGRFRQVGVVADCTIAKPAEAR